MSSIFKKCTEKPRVAARAVRLSVFAIFLLAVIAAFAPAAKAQPANDFFTNFMVIAGAAGTQPGSNVGSTQETNEPVHYAGSPFSQRSVWFQWTAPQNGIVTFDTIGSGFDTILAAYLLTGTNIDVVNLVLPSIASDDDTGAGFPLFWSLIRFPVTAGTNYYIALDGYRTGPLFFQPDNGPYILNWTMDTNPVVILPLDTVQFLSANYTVTESGIFATITVGYGGDGGLGGGADVTVDFFTSDGTASDGTHYRGTNGTLTFSAGQTIASFDVPIINNTNLNNDRTVLLHLTNVSGNALLGNPSTALLTIQEDLAEARLSTAGMFSFSSTLYSATEFETLTAPFPNPPGRGSSLPVNNRSPLGVLVTITRSAPAEGRVLVDFATAPPANGLPAAKETIEYTPASGTLVFDDYQMSTTILIPVFSDAATNPPVVIVPGQPPVLTFGNKYFDIVLSNPRPDPLEVTNAPDKIVPTLNPFVARTTVQILDLLSGPGFSFERTSYRVLEGTRFIDLDVILPSGVGGSVGVRVLPNRGDRYTFLLKAASDYADGGLSDDDRFFPNSFYTDGTLAITNPTDFEIALLRYISPTGQTNIGSDITMTFPTTGPCCIFRQSIRLFITNDTFVEFNEDIRLQLHDPTAPPGFGANPIATVTILFDEQPTGAVDREWNPEGIERTQPPFYSTPGANNTVSGLAVQPDNRTVLVGDFTAVNSVSRNRIARLNQDGSLDLSFNPGTGADGHVEAVLVYTNGPNIGKMLVVGDFTSINNIQRRGLARLNPNGSLDTTFNPGTGADGPVRSLTTQSDGKVLISGDFQHFNDLEVNGIMRLNADGSLDSSFNPGRGANGTIWAVAVRDTAGVIFAPRTAIGTELEDVNVVDTGANQGTITVDFDFLGIPDNIRIYYDGVRIFDLTTNLVGQLNIPFGPGLSSTVTIILNEGVGIPGTAWFYRAFVTPVVEERTIYVAGEFTSFDGNVRNGVARLRDDGSLDPAFDPGVGVDGPVYALGVQANNRLLIGGAFSSFQNSRRSNMARLLSNGNLDLDYHVVGGANGPVYAITIQPDNGKALIGGRFTEYNFTRRVGLARLFPAGTLDTSFLDTGYNQFAGLIRTYSFEPPRFVNAIALQTNGNVMIGGSFTALGGNFSDDHSLSNIIFLGQFSIVSGGTVFAPFTRADKNTRYNIASLIGGYTLGPGNLEYDPSAQPFTIDENSQTFYATVRRADGRLGGPVMPGFTSNITARAGQDYGAANLGVNFGGRYVAVPLSVGIVSPHYMAVPIFDDTKREGDEIFGLFARSISNSIVLGGEYIPLGGSIGFNDSVQVAVADNDFDHGEFNFSIGNYTTNENVVTARISVIRTNGSSGAVSVDYLVLNGTAIAGQDYQGIVGPRQLNFAAGQTNHTFTIALLNSPLVEADETIRLILTNATGGATLPGGSPISTATATLTIIDDDFLGGRLNFAAANYVTNESAVNAVIEVTRTGSTLGALRVQYETFDGTATAPADYAARSGTLEWDSGVSTAKTFLVPLTMDGIVEGNETFNVRLLNPTTAGAIGPQSNATVTIVDSDAYGTLSFSQPYYETDENGGLPIITVVRRNGSAGTVSVNFSTVALTATNGVDYFDTNGVLTFLPGEVSKTFRVPIINDNEQDGDRTIGLVLSSPVNATLGSVSNSVLNLVDDESINLTAGSLDTTFSEDAAANGIVYAVVLQTNGSIVMAGDFTRIKATPRNRLARLNPDGTLDNTFDIGPGANDSIRALALQSDGRLLVGGIFTTINGTNRNHIARLSTDGKVDIAFDPGAGADNPVFAVLVQPNDQVLAGGSFSTFNGGSSPGLVRMNTNGTVDIHFNVGAGFNGTVYALALQDDGKVLVGGDFVSFGGISRTNLVRLNSNGSLDATFNPALSLNAPVRAILTEPDGRIVIGGSFTNINGVTRRYLARLEKDGALDPSFLPDADNTVYVIKQQVDGKLIIGGDFLFFNGVTRHGLTRLNDVDGSTDPTINFGNGANGFVATLAIQPDRRIILGGSFTEYDNQPRLRIARIYGGSIFGPGSIEFGQPIYLASESAGNAVITVTRRGGTTGAVSARYSTLDDTAFAGIDYLSVSDVLQFPEGETRQFFLVPLLPNFTANGDRAAGLLLSDFIGAAQGPQWFGSLLILDDESVLSFTTMDYSVNENTISGNATIGVRRTGGTNTTVSVNFSAVNGTAIAGQDYIATNGTLTFLPGQTFKNFNVSVLDDSSIEGNETVSLHLSGQTASAGLAISAATLVVVDDDSGFGQFLFATNNFVVDEFGANVLVTVIRTNGSSGIVSVRLQTSDGTATAGADYFATNRTLTFADGVTVQFIAIPIFNDSLQEPDETFNVTLSNPELGASILEGSALVTIVDDEFAPSFVGFPTNNFYVNESAGFATISVVRTNGRRGVVSADFTVSAGTASAADFIVASGTLTFLDNERIKTFTVSIFNDSLAEPVETVALNLSNLQTDGTTTASFSLPTSALNIVDDDTGGRFASVTNTTPITINSFANGTPASPYPATLTVSGVVGPLSRLTVTLRGLSHTYPDDIDMVLMAPNGQTVMLMSDAGGANAVANVTAAFDDAAAFAIPDNTPITNGTYRPANYLVQTDPFPVPAPSSPYGTTLSSLNGINPNGVWSLFIVDDSSEDFGTIAGGWSLTVATADQVVLAPELALNVIDSPDPVSLSGTFTYTITIMNQGLATASSVMLTNVLPFGVSLISVGSGSFTQSGNVLVGSIGSIPVGSSLVVTITMRAPNTSGLLTLDSTVGAAEMDFNPGNNHVSINTTVSGPAPAVPLLFVKRKPGRVELSWQSASTNLMLQTSSSVDFASWSAVTDAPVISNGVTTVTLPMSGGPKFFRLSLVP